MQCGGLSGKEVQERGEVCMHMAGSFCCMVETGAML